MARKLLLIEDEKPILDDASCALMLAGYEVATASTGREISQYLKANTPFDAIITDYYLKDNRGNIHLRGDHCRLALRQVYRDIPIIGVSSDITTWDNLTPMDTNLHPVPKIYTSLGRAWNTQAIIAKLTELDLAP